MPSIRDARILRDAANADYAAQVVAAYRAGRSMADIAREAGVSRQRVWRIIQDTPAVTTTPTRALVKLERRTP